MPSPFQIGSVAATGLLCMLPLIVQAEIVKCSAPDGSLTYTDSRCSGSLMVGGMQSGRTAFSPPASHSTQWAAKIAPRQVRTDVESVRSAYDALKRRDTPPPIADVAGN